MNIASPPSTTTTAQAEFAASDLLAYMLEDMADAIPVRPAEPPERTAHRHNAARTMVIGLRPVDAVEAAIAIAATVAFFASVSLHSRATSPAATEREATNLSRVAMAEQRAFNAGVRDLNKRHAPAEPPARQRGSLSHKPEAEPEVIDTDPIPHLPEFQPRNRYGEPIPLYRFRDMTRLQRLATYGDPFDKAAWDLATEEEEVAIAEQKAMDAAAKATGATAQGPNDPAAG
jgi:hypothetical protein